MEMTKEQYIEKLGEMAAVMMADLETTHGLPSEVFLEKWESMTVGEQVRVLNDYISLRPNLFNKFEV